MASTNTKVTLPEYKYGDELIATAKAIVAPGKGILAADESTGTIGKRFSAINVENNRENRRAYRHLLFTTKDIGKSISGAITFEETLFETTEDGKTSFVDLMKAAGIIPGIKVDKGTRHIPFTDAETYTQGLTDLDLRCKKYYEAGARFAKWRNVLRISSNTPSEQAIVDCAQTLASYAAICQDNGLVPIVEPEILMDGDHDIATCQFITEKVLGAVYKALNQHNVLLEGTLLKPNMVCSGAECPVQADAKAVATATVRALQRTVPAAVPGVVFLSGGQTEESATVNLHYMNALDLGARPWRLSFSYGRALQKSCLAVWQGKTENVEAAQEALLVRANANGAATAGKYDGGAATATATESNYQANYTY
jgi:fructose-bisphosphate aldolase, class I